MSTLCDERPFEIAQTISAWTIIVVLGYLGHPSGRSAEPLAVFYAVGDSPYILLEVPLLATQVRSLPEDAAFLVHLGDIKLGSAPCDEPSYRQVADLLSGCRRPVFVVPGDNEWNDCSDPDQAWRLWEKYFLRFEQRWKLPFDVHRATDYPENFAFRIKTVFFVGLNLVGGRVQNEQEWSQRHRANLRWLSQWLPSDKNATHCVIMAHAALREPHQDFVQGLREAARRFDRPMLYLHGDGHGWIFDQPFGAANLWRIQVDRGGLVPPVQIRIHPDRRQPFQFDRRLRPAPGH